MPTILVSRVSFAFVTRLQLVILAIMLSRIKLDLQDIKKALLDVDDSKLTLDDLRSISRQLPTPEEVGSANACCNELAEEFLDHPDQGLRGRWETGQIRPIL